MPPRPIRLLLSTLGCVILAMGAPRSASATVLVAADLSELVASAAVIVHGRVVNTEAQWLEGRRGIETLVTLEVEDALKGASIREVTFRVPGGQMGPYRSVMPGTPSFGEGDEVIVFLGGSGPAIPHLVGFSQGVFRVSGDGEAGRVVRGSVPLAVPPSATRMARGDGAVGPTPLASFEDRVRTLARPGGPR